MHTDKRQSFKNKKTINLLASTKREGLNIQLIMSLNNSQILDAYPCAIPTEYVQIKTMQ